MDVNQKIHLLAFELIPVINDLDDETKEIVLEHIQHCSECRHFYKNVIRADESLPKATPSNEMEIRPLKKLVQFNRGLKLFLIFIRAVILFYILYSGLHFYDWETSSIAAMEYIQGVLYLFYLPASLFLIIFTITFFNKKWIWASVIFDLMIVLFFDHFLAFFN
ncbi:zf-HC2 domain-containing protein [Bacillus sp. 1P06AnD]|uniref:zf-HC2 domain-containing protein n=1 Tax=Bacillus sp. 1P06AnD TaxID=3132208 RepID=UPI0039A30F69